MQFIETCSDIDGSWFGVFFFGLTHDERYMNGIDHFLELLKASALRMLSDYLVFHAAPSMAGEAAATD